MICDCDWESFFVVCEECDLLPPSLAVVDDSGMSDFDDTGLIFANRLQKVDLTARFPGVGDGSPDCGDSPVEDYLSKHGVSGMESVPSASEENIHLQSVNIFFGQQKNTTEAERFTEPSQVSAGKIREAIQVGKHWCDGQQTSSIPELHCLPARGGRAVGKETSEPFGTMIKKDESGSNIYSEPAASKSALRTKTLAHPESKLTIIDEACPKARFSEATRWRQPHDSPDGIERTPNNDKVINVERSAPLGDVRHEDVLKNQFTPKKASNSDATSATETVTQGSSPPASVKRKRRKRRRVRAGPAVGEHGGERQVLVTLGDSDEEQQSCGGGGGLCVSDDIHSFHLNEPLKNVTSSSAAYSAISHVSVKISAKETEGNDLSHRGPPCGSAVRRGRCKATDSAVDNATKAPLSQTDDCAISTNVQPCSKLLVEESTVLDSLPEWPVSAADDVTGESGMTTGSAKRGRKDIRGGSLQQSVQMNHSAVCIENEQLLCTSTVEPLTPNILPSTDLYDPAVEVSQSHKVSAAKSVLAEEAGNSGNNTLCQRQVEPQRQLGTGCRYADQYSSTLEKTHFPLLADSTRNSDAPNTKPMQCKTRVDSVKAALHSNSSADQCCPTGSASSLDLCVTAQHTEHPAVPQTLSGLDVLTEINTTAERSEIKAFPNRDPSPAGETNLTGKSLRGVKLSTCEDFLTGLSVGTPVSSCCSLGLVLSTGNITHMSGNSDPTDSSYDSVLETEEASTASKAEDVSESALFAMSSFWREMEKVTIKDILGLRTISKAAPPSEKTEAFSLMDSGFFNQSKPQPTNEDTSRDGNAHSGSGKVSSRGITWESEHIYTANGTSVCHISPPVQSESAQTCHRKMSKNVSVRDLRVLESLDDTGKGQALQTVTKGELENVDYDNGHVPEQDKGRYRISLTHILHYLFGEKPSNPSQSATEGVTTTSYTEGNSVPESYDHFFSEFDAGSLFSPLSAADQANDEPVCSRSLSANRNLHFPEAYDYFFASSSSDDSSEESDEEDNSCPVRVVKSVNQRSSETSTISTDIYENFFTEDDLRQNFFWKSTFSFRTMSSTTPVVQRHSLSDAAVAVRPSSGSLRRTVHPINAFGHHRVMFSDPPLYNLEDRISREVAQQPFRFDKLETTANPSLDAPLLPLRQSDMCLVCIAFASWVLKTANPQVGDAWKAVLLANVSALSAIRCLRKYVEMEAAAGETKEITSQHPF